MKKIWLYFMPLLSLPFAASGCGFGDWRWGYGRHMMNFEYGGGIIWVILLIVVGVVIYLLLRASKLKGFDGADGETSLDILKRRYAKGEITKEEFDKMKADIEN